jgi:hypothetical protein
MPQYPDIDSDFFYSDVVKLYNDYKIKADNSTYDEYCSVNKSFKLLPPQQFVAQFINPKTPYSNLLVFHKIGSGKTCAAIQIAEQWITKRRIVVVLPASLILNFMNELRGMCGNYLTDKERKILKTVSTTSPEYKKIINISDTRINKYYTIYSYNKFIDNIDTISLKNSVLIVDEIHNMISEHGSNYTTLYHKLKQSPKDLKIILMSATPMFDKPSEIALIINLLKDKGENNLPVGIAFNEMFIKSHKNGTSYDINNVDLFKQYIRGYISYYKGAPDYTFPEMFIKYKYCTMSNFQYNIYKNILANESPNATNITNMLDLPNHFFIGTRMVSNIVYPNKKLNNAGLESLTKSHILHDLDKYSCKFFAIMKKIQSSSGKIFIYSSFKEFGGIRSFIKILDIYGYSNFVDTGSGHRRYCIWSSDETSIIKNKIFTTFNSVDNIYGKHIKILLGSPSIKEGVSLNSIRQVHILEPYWNLSRIQQIIGRASRFCSHKYLKADERNVKVYIYIAVAPDDTDTIDKHIKHIADNKNKLIMQFEKALKESAVDCKLNLNANNTENEKIICDK